MYLIEYLIKFKEIDIDMEDFYSKILKKYNYRRRQLYLMIAVIILIVDVFLELLKLNIKISVNNPERNNGTNYIKVKIKINESQCQAEHNIRLYYTKKFSYYIRKINIIFSKCRNCKDFICNLCRKAYASNMFKNYCENCKQLYYCNSVRFVC